MRTIIAGSRTVTDYDLVQLACEKCGWTITEVVSGGAKGVDKMGERWAREHKVPMRQFIPEWKKHGRVAGFLRNQEMAEYAEALIAVWDGYSKGTADMIARATHKGMDVYVVNGLGEGGFNFSPGA